MTPQPISSRAIKDLAGELGFALCGVCEARPSDHGAFFRRWLAEGRHGQMTYLARNVEVRLDPGKLLAGAKSVIVVADAVAPARRERKLAEAGGHEGPAVAEDNPALASGPDGRARVARYARFSDYHKVLKKRLHRLADALAKRFADHHFQGRVTVDTAPMMEREHAVRAGLGWIGKHTLLLNRSRGSHLLLGTIVTTLAIEPDAPQTDHCRTCRRCIEACPTQCITPYSVDASRCISYLTIEHRTAIEPSRHEAVGEWLFGCDVCQDVCPYVKKAGQTSPPLEEWMGGQPDTASDQPDSLTPAPSLGFGSLGACSPERGGSYQRLHDSFDPLAVLNWTEDDRRAAFRASALKRAKLDMMKRNALIVAGNQLAQRDRPALRRKIEQLADDPTEPDLVRRTARDVLGRLVNPEPGAGQGSMTR